MNVFVRNLILVLALACSGCQGPDQDPYTANVREAIHLLKLDAEPAKLKQYLALANEIRQDQRRLPQHYSVITAQDSLYLGYQLILEEYFRQSDQRPPGPSILLRAPDPQLYETLNEFLADHPLFGRCIDVYDYLDEYFRDREALEGEELLQEFLVGEWDANPKISYQLISASLGLETATVNDSALAIFLQGRGVAQSPGGSLSQRRDRVVQQLYGALKGSVAESTLRDLIAACPLTDEGIVLQLFIPKSDVESILYASQAFGLRDCSATSDLHRFFQDFKVKSSSSPFPLQEPIQVRVLAGALFNNDIHIQRYTLLDPAQIERFRQFIRTTLMVAEGKD